MSKIITLVYRWSAAICATCAAISVQGHDVGKQGGVMHIPRCVAVDSAHYVCDGKMVNVDASADLLHSLFESLCPNCADPLPIPPPLNEPIICGCRKPDCPDCVSV